MEKLLFFHQKMSQQVNDCLDQVETEKGCLIITGKEGMFSAGLDLKTIQSGDMDKILEMSSNAFKLLARIFSFPRPVIAACSGHGIALGTFLICCCDYRIGVKGDFMLGANEMRTKYGNTYPILELIKFRVNNSHKVQSCIRGRNVYFRTSKKEAGLMDEVVNAKESNECSYGKSQGFS